MALTAQEEALVRQLLDQQAAILSLAGNEATIMSKLGATKVTLADLVAASSLADADLLLTRQGTTDKSVRADILAAYMGAELGALFAPIANPTFTGDPKAPTPAQFDNDTSLATTAFVQRALGNYWALVSTNAPVSLTGEDVGKAFGINSAGAVNLPLANTVPSGASLAMIANTNGVVVLPSGGDNLYTGAGAVVSISMGAGDTLTVISDGRNWYAFSGSAQLSASSVFSSSLTGRGYQKLPSGLIIQWGTYSLEAAGGSRQAITFPVAFPTALIHPSVSVIDAATNMIGTIAYSLTGMTISKGIHDQSARTGFWQAIGY